MANKKRWMDDQAADMSSKAKKAANSLSGERGREIRNIVNEGNVVNLEPMDAAQNAASMQSRANEAMREWANTNPEAYKQFIQSQLPTSPADMVRGINGTNSQIEMLPEAQWANRGTDYQPSLRGTNTVREGLFNNYNFADRAPIEGPTGDRINGYGGYNYLTATDNGKYPTPYRDVAGVRDQLAGAGNADPSRYNKPVAENFNNPRNLTRMPQNIRGTAGQVWPDSAAFMYNDELWQPKSPADMAGLNPNFERVAMPENISAPRGGYPFTGEDMKGPRSYTSRPFYADYEPLGDDGLRSFSYDALQYGQGSEYPMTKEQAVAERNGQNHFRDAANGEPAAQNFNKTGRRTGKAIPFHEGTYEDYENHITGRYGAPYSRMNSKGDVRVLGHEIPAPSQADYEEMFTEEQLNKMADNLKRQTQGKKVEYKDAAMEGYPKAKGNNPKVQTGGMKYPEGKSATPFMVPAGVQMATNMIKGGNTTAGLVGAAGILAAAGVNATMDTSMVVDGLLRMGADANRVVEFLQSDEGKRYLAEQVDGLAQRRLENGID